MKFLHTADSHLGYSAYTRLSSEGYNQREMDVYKGFEQTIDAAIDNEVDMFIHAGDLFDSVRPNNRALSFALDQILRLSRAEIPFIVISGNHDTPRLRGTGSVFRLFEHIDNVYPVYKGEYEAIEIGDTIVHCLPQCMNDASLREQMKRINIKNNKKNMAVLHVGVVGISVFRTGELNEHLIDTTSLSSKLDYIALGHYHGHTELSGNTYYAGSTERLSFSEASEDKGLIIGDLDKGKYRFVEIETRPMIDLKPVNYKPEMDLMKEIESRILKKDIEDSITRLKINGMPPHVYHGLDFQRLKRLKSPALHFDMRFSIKREEMEIQAQNISFKDLTSEFDTFFSKHPVEELDRKRLRDMGISYLAEQVENEGVGD